MPKESKKEKDKTEKLQEIAKVYATIRKELDLLEVEGKELKKEVMQIVDKVKTKNILEDIFNDK